MLKTDMHRILRFTAVEGIGPYIEGSRGGRVETIARAQAGVLSPPAIGEIGRRQQADRLLPVASQRLLRQVVDMDWQEAIELAAIGVIGRVIIVDPRQDI